MKEGKKEKKEKERKKNEGRKKERRREEEERRKELIILAHSNTREFIGRLSGRTSYIIWRGQCQMKTQGPFFKKYQEFQDNSRALNQVGVPSKCKAL